MKTILPLFLLVLACAPMTPEKFASDKPLYEHASKLYNEGSFTDSIAFYESLRNRFPQSPYLTDTELKIGEARYNKRDYAEAEVDLKTFRTLHPTHAKIPYVTYLLGMTHYKRIPGSIDRDQTQTQLALVVFTELTRRWPSSEHVKEVVPFMERCREDLLRRDLYIGNFYLGQKKYGAALQRLQNVRESAEFKALYAEATYKLGFAHYKLENVDQAKELLTLSTKDPNTKKKYQEKAKRLLKKLGSK